MIQESVKVHDKYQFEIKLGYKVFESEQDTQYNIEIYFFFPGSLDINSHTYTKQDFYKDLRTYIRFKTPSVILRHFMDKDSPFEKLKSCCERLLKEPESPAICKEYIHKIKMFCCILKSALRDHVKFVALSESPDSIKILINEYLSNLQKIRDGFRSLYGLMAMPNMPVQARSYFLFSDEYISHRIEQYSFSLLRILKKNTAEEDIKYTKQIYDLIEEEFKYREKNKFPSIPRETGDNEEVVFRKSVLKRFIGSILFLKTRSEKEGFLLEQILFGVAAGLSMMFATAVAFFSQSKFGSISLPVFIVLIVSYIFKDRIKELLRMYFAKNLQKVFFDHKIILYTAEREKIGLVKEVFYFIKEKNIPKEIMRMRDRDHITEIENGLWGEKIAVYIEQVRLSAKKLKNIFKDYSIDSINDIMRFDISKFLSKMDNPQKAVFLFHRNEFKKIYADRVYHINMIIKYQMKNNMLYKKFRIVLNRDGIKRIEETLSEMEKF
ncbi:MAG: hypothetical protein BWY26_00250 [Elusimicrobia bacterium ADurb.Bin231]|nr:MAG: hypothetical protein BWY26_00250 [Elusimicrobia bacterium ADurb.Bin231]